MSILDENGGFHADIPMLRWLEDAVKKIGIRNLLRALAQGCQAIGMEHGEESLLATEWQQVADDPVEFAGNIRGLRR